MHRRIRPLTPNQRSLRRITAEVLFLGAALRELARPVIGLTSIFLIGMVVHRYLGAPPGGDMPTWSDAIFNSFCLLMLEHVDPLPENRLAQAVQYVQPVVGAFWLAEGVIKLGMTLFDKRHNPEQWIGIMASASDGHIILCGLGTVGMRVLAELSELGQHVFVIEQRADCPFVDRARELGAEVYIGDARAEQILATLNLKGARAVIVATDNDLANIEIALDIRDARKDVPIVMRLYDLRLAERVRGTLGIEVCVSTSAVAAPLFATAALDQHVVGTHRVGSTLLVVVEVRVNAGSKLDGARLAPLLAEHGISVVAVCKPDAAWSVHPAHYTAINAGDEVQLMVRGNQLDRVHELNGEEMVG